MQLIMQIGRLFPSSLLDFIHFIFVLFFLFWLHLGSNVIMSAKEQSVRAAHLVCSHVFHK